MATMPSALAAAVALRDAVTGDGVLGGRLILRVGVNTGEVVASNDQARGEFLVTGDAVNVAARLETAAAPREILASERTRAASEAAMRFGAARKTSASPCAPPRSSARARRAGPAIHPSSDASRTWRRSRWCATARSATAARSWSRWSPPPASQDAPARRVPDPLAPRRWLARGHAPALDRRARRQ
jgi:hypothetical protein